MYTCKGAAKHFLHVCSGVGDTASGLLVLMGSGASLEDLQSTLS